MTDGSIDRDRLPINPDEYRFIGVSKQVLTEDGPATTVIYVDGQIGEERLALVNQIRVANGGEPYARLTPEQIYNFNHPRTIQKPETLRSMGRKLIDRVLSLKK